MAASTQAKPCLEDMNLIEFDQKEHTDNFKFGPTNNRFTKKTKDELIDEIEWMDAQNSVSQDDDIKKMHEANVTRLLAFEKYKEEMISE